MIRGVKGSLPFWWWFASDDDGSESDEESSEMVYTCDASTLEAPHTADCELLAYSGLGGLPSDTVTVGSGETSKVLS